MQRRQLLKLLVPVGMLAAGVVAGVSVFRHVACKALDSSSLLQYLKPFADEALGKAVAAHPVADDPKHFESLCEERFDEGYRELVTRDFVAGKVNSVDGWLLSETETLTHYLVYLSGARQAVGSAP